MRQSVFKATERVGAAVACKAIRYPGIREVPTAALGASSCARRATGAVQCPTAGRKMRYAAWLQVGAEGSRASRVALISEGA